VLRPERNLGSKAKAQNYALAQIVARPESDHPDLVVPVDADTVFARDYLTEIQKPFTDPNVAIAGGSVLTRHAHTIWERGRLVEYLTGFHFYRQVQNAFDSPLVCSGCCSAFRLTYLVEFGGFPERTIVEDIDYAWSQQIMGRRGRRVRGRTGEPDLPAEAIEPLEARIFPECPYPLAEHAPTEEDARPLGESLLVQHNNQPTDRGHASDLAAQRPQCPAGYVVERRGGSGNPRPSPVDGDRAAQTQSAEGVAVGALLYVLKMINFWYDMKCFVIELILVPRGLATGLHHYVKGRSDDLDVRAGAIAAVQPVVTPPSVPAPRQRIRHESEPTTAPPTTAPSAPNRGEYDLDWSIERWREYLHSETTAAIDELNRELRSISEDCYPQLWRAT
jgi:hypothetical protein